MCISVGKAKELLQWQSFRNREGNTVGNSTLVTRKSLKIVLGVGVGFCNFGGSTLPKVTFNFFGPPALPRQPLSWGHHFSSSTVVELCG